MSAGCDELWRRAEANRRFDSFGCAPGRISLSEVSRTTAAPSPNVNRRSTARSSQLSWQCGISPCQGHPQILEAPGAAATDPRIGQAQSSSQPTSSVNHQAINVIEYGL